MSDRPSCEEVRALAPELALGIAVGPRARAEHPRVPGGPPSRGAVERRRRPPRSPRPRSRRSVRRVRRAEERSERPERRRRRPLIAVAAAAVAALVTASAMWLAFDDDRDLADRYRETLAVANGKYLAACAAVGAGGRRAGTVFGYEGDPSWVLVTVYESARPEPGRYELEVITAKGRRMDLRPMWIYPKGQRRRRDPDPLPRRHRGAPARPRPRECPPR